MIVLLLLLRERSLYVTMNYLIGRFTHHVQLLGQIIGPFFCKLYSFIILQSWMCHDWVGS